MQQAKDHGGEKKSCNLVLNHHLSICQSEYESCPCAIPRNIELNDQVSSAITLLDAKVNWRTS